MSKIEKKAQSIEDRVPAHRAARSAPVAPAAPPRTPGRAVPVKTEPSSDMADRVRPRANAPTQKRNVVPGQASGGTPAVKEMQQAILNFAATAASTDVTSMKGNQHGQQTGNQSRLINTDLPESRDLSSPLDEHKEQLGGNDPFGDFIVQQYVATDPIGKQYLNVDVAGKKERSDASINDSSLRGMIDTISRVGTKGVNAGEKSVDGVWAHRTDNALAGILTLTNAMLNFARDLKVAVRYTQQELDAFKAAVPKVYTAITDKGAAAKEVTPHVNAATQFFQELKKAVLNNREVRQYIDQKKPFASYPKSSKKSTEEVLNANELATFQTNQTEGIPQVGFAGVPEKSNWISLKELSDMESFKGFMKRIGKGKEAENPAEVKKMLDAVSTQLGPAKAGY